MMEPGAFAALAVHELMIGGNAKLHIVVLLPKHLCACERRLMARDSAKPRVAELAVREAPPSRLERVGLVQGFSAINLAINVMPDNEVRVWRGVAHCTGHGVFANKPVTSIHEQNISSVSKISRPCSWRHRDRHLLRWSIDLRSRHISVSDRVCRR